MVGPQICRKRQLLHSKRVFEAKSSQCKDDDVYFIINELVKELYFELVLKPGQSHLMPNQLAFADRTFIKHLSIYLCHVMLGHSMRKIAKGFNLDRTSVSYACRKIEDKRDDLSCERFIAACERLIDILAIKLEH